MDWREYNIQGLKKLNMFVKFVNISTSIRPNPSDQTPCTRSFIAETALLPYPIKQTGVLLILYAPIPIDAEHHKIVVHGNKE
jgi:hypothetical protein